MVDADFLAGVVGYAVVGSGFRLDDASETAVGCQAFLRDLVLHEAVGSPRWSGGRGVIHLRDRTCWWVMPCSGRHEVG